MKNRQYQIYVQIYDYDHTNYTVDIALRYNFALIKTNFNWKGIKILF